MTCIEKHKRPGDIHGYMCLFTCNEAIGSSAGYTCHIYVFSPEYLRHFLKFIKHWQVNIQRDFFLQYLLIFEQKETVIKMGHQ